MKVLIVPDKFKGTLSATAAAEAIAKGWAKSRPADSLDLAPATDGGDGFGEVLAHLLGARMQRLRTVDAARRPCVARWWWAGSDKTAIIDSAEIIGLARLPPGRFHPFDLDSFGLSAALLAARTKGARRCLIGLGGSATNDGGFGVARGLGWRFLDRSGRAVERWRDLGALGRICPPGSRTSDLKIIVAVDVQNPLLGARGASRVYGPQKGLRKQDFATAEHCLRCLSRCYQKTFNASLERLPGAGAAGGLGFGLSAFVGAQLKPGFELFARYAGVDPRLRRADCVITGEGVLDRSTLMGKGVGQIARCCQQFKIPCVALVGQLKTRTEWHSAFTEVHALTELTSVAQAKAKPAKWLECLGQRVARLWAAV